MVNLKIDRYSYIRGSCVKTTALEVEEEGAFKITGNPPMKDYWGGVAEITIRKSDAKIIHIIHGR